ncbi:hypothetical protein [Microvirga calopogonii]|uniref:hypothetical protein n=1 Tax=Microvirga calopogonii TaxID=2078013 RepID=UPI001FDF5449|nr:hypothetical protein [Microvirga calopogonii]
MSDEEAIKSAMEAAPPAVAKNATVMVANEQGEMRTVRKGTNGFTCIPDDPNSPGPDPMCMDANALDWVAALIGRKDPPPGKVGFMYMLRGGTDSSNTDPFATKPEPNNNWVETGSHVMIVGAKGMMQGYPRDPKPDTSQPYVMYADTPYEHLMIPVQPPEVPTR